MIGKTLNRIGIFLGPNGTRALIVWLAFTGLASLILNAFVNQYDWVRPVQTLLVLAFLIGAAVIVGVRLPPEE
ncbi:MAG TPA: hypothetical protein VHO69_07245, partial [Phototrophicaceae bacterium]|nr:hypothetical protein [Phototrophicaceae bacterium]